MTDEFEQNKTSQTATAREGVPPITEEAIAFLRNPNPKAIDIFRLGADSRAFVEYHITNLQRIEAYGEVTRRVLDAMAPRFSPRFEKVVDALLSVRTKQNAIAAMPAADFGRSTPIGTTSADYAPKQLAATVPQPVKVQTGRMEITTGTGSSEPSHGAVEARKAPSSAKSADAVASNERVENVIERGTDRERRVRTGESRTDSLRDAEGPAEPATGFNAGIGRRMLRTMSGIARTAAVWLQSKADKAPVPPPSPSPPLLKRATGRRLPGTGDISMPMPDTVKQRFLRVEQDYYFPDRTHAFSDQGNRLATRGSHPEVVRSLVEIAKARGWESITVKGSDEFRRSAWMEAARSGLQVAGYKPTDLDLAELAQRPSRNAVEKGASTELTRTSRPEVLVSGQQPVHATAGASQKPRSTGRDNDKGPDPQLVAKAQSFKSDRPAFAVAKHPELAPAYGIVEVARKFAEASLPESAREEFIGLARRHVMQKIIAGERLKGPQIYASADKSKDKSEQERQSAQPNQDTGKPPRSKSAERER